MIHLNTESIDKYPRHRPIVEENVHRKIVQICSVDTT